MATTSHRTADETLLEGLLVVSTALNVPGPVALARLRSMGAKAIKIEPPEGDPLARHCRPWYELLRAGIAVETVDLKTVEGRRQLDRHIANAGVLMTGQRPAALERLGLNWKMLHGRFPRLCQVAIVGFSPPRENEPGHDLTYLAAEGLITPPDVPRTLVVDLAGAERAVSAALALRLAWATDGVGRYSEVVLADVAHMMAAPLRHGLTTPGAILGGGYSGYGLYRASQGWVAVAALEPHFLDRLHCELCGSDPNEEQIVAVFATRTALEWEAWGREHDVPVIAVREG